VRIRPRLSGICGSDLSTIGSKGSPYFSPFASMPFVLGHELVGEITELGGAVPTPWAKGRRIVLEPVLHCAVRGVTPPCPTCAAGHYAHCEKVTAGILKPGIQTGYCASTGGGWSEAGLVAHHTQLHAVPEGMCDEEAVLAEPLACALHGALKAPLEESATLLVIGCGSIGLLTIFAYRAMGGRGRVLALARYRHQAEMARQLGATECFTGRGTQATYSWVLRHCGRSDADIYQPELGKPVVLGGVDATLDCVGNGTSMDDSLRLTRPRGKVVLIGMPGIPKGIDWTSAWHKELLVEGAYAYGWETNRAGGPRRTLELALEAILAHPGVLRPLVSRGYALADYRQALHDAFHAGSTGSFKCVFKIP
jgi:threonine dehydrogenase-like Zn-dependent dehydrogenase